MQFLAPAVKAAPASESALAISAVLDFGQNQLNRRHPKQQRSHAVLPAARRQIAIRHQSCHVGYVSMTTSVRQGRVLKLTADCPTMVHMWPHDDSDAAVFRQVDTLSTPAEFPSRHCRDPPHRNQQTLQDRAERLQGQVAA